MTAQGVISPRASARALPIERPSPRLTRWVQPSILPGFPLALGVTLAYLGAIVVLPLTALALRPWELGLDGVWRSLTEERVLDALKLSFGVSALAAAINAPLGLPFALPTAVAGIALTALYAPTGPLGGIAAKVGIKTAYTPLGIFIALLFIGLPFVVRQVQPMLLDFDQEAGEAARTLGATPFQRFSRVMLPAIAPALLSGVGLAFARAVGEYGSVIFIAGNLPKVSEIAPLIVVIRLEQFDYAGAAAVGLAMVVISFGSLLLINAAQVAIGTRRQA